MAEKDDKKGLFLLLGLFGLGGGLAWAMSRGKPSGYGAAVSLQILDAATGEPVPRHSPALVVEGGSYIARFTVTNQSTRLGAPIAADLGLTIAGVAGAVVIPFVGMWIAGFGPGQALSWDITFTIPDNTGGQTGSIVVQVWPPTGPALASAEEPLTIESAAIIYGAAITPIQVL